MSDKANAVPAHRIWQETFRWVAAEFAELSRSTATWTR